MKSRLYCNSSRCSAIAFSCDVCWLFVLDKDRPSLISLGDIGDRLGWGQRRGLVLHILLPLVESVAFTAEEDEPVDLRWQDAEAAQVGGEREMKENTVERDAVVGAVGPVHAGEECDAAHEETQQHHAAINLVQPAVLHPQLQEETVNTEEWEEEEGKIKRRGQNKGILNRLFPQK